MERVQVQATAKGWCLEVELNANSNGLKAADVDSQLRTLGYANLSVNREVLDEFLSQIEFEVAQLDADQTTTLTSPVIAPNVDASVQVIVSDDKMSAKAKVTNAIGGKAVDLEMIKMAAQEAGIKFGLKGSLVTACINAAKSTAVGERFEHQVAQGQLPVNGKNAKLKPLVSLFAEKVRTPKQTEDGKADLRDLGNIETVEENTPILEKIPFTLGKSGYNVFAEKIPAAPGEDVELMVGSGTKIDDKNHFVLLATQTGLARFNGRMMEVDDVVVYPQLDPKQGNIKFKGSVIIKGDISPEMKVIATGDVVVGGFVESSTIKCGGQLTLMSGASGKASDDGENYNCKLMSGADVIVAFANQCEITAKHSVVVRKQISHCNVTADAMTVGTGDKPKGQVAGGRFYLCKSLRAGTIGTESNVHCDISMNRTYDVFRVKEAELSTWIDTLQERYDAQEAEFNRVMDPAVKEQCQQKMTVLKRKLDKYQGHRSALMAKRREYMERVNVEIFHALYPKVTFYVSNRVHQTDAIKGPSRVHIEDYELIVEPLA